MTAERPRPETQDANCQTLRRDDGRILGYAEFGDPDGTPVLAFHGTPVSRLIFRLADEAARARNLRLIAPDRPGYGLSTHQPGRRIVDWPADVAALADHLGFDQFAIIGLSGGAPFAVACAHQLGDQVGLAALISPVGPMAEFKGPMGLSNLQKAIYGGAARSPLLSRLMFRGLSRLNRRRPEFAYGALMRRSSQADRAILSGVQHTLLDCMNDGLSAGCAGPAHDLHLFGKPWGFPIEEVIVPCIIWQGTDDQTVPPRAAYALADRLPVCRLDRVPGAGHFWVIKNIGRVLDAVAVALKA